MLLRTTIVAGLLVLCTGCGPKFLDEREEALQVGEFKSIPFGPLKKDLKMVFDVSSPGKPFSIYVFPIDQQEQVDYAITYGKEPPGTLAGVAETEETNFEAIIPAGSEIIVRVQNLSREESTIKLKMSG